jgi:hypothetical protein
MSDLIITKKQLMSLVLSEQDTGFTNFLDKTYSNSKSAEKYNNEMGGLVKKISNYLNNDAEEDLRDFMYSPEGIATTILINDTVYGTVVTEMMFAILLTYDIKKWVNEGEPNWLYLIADLLCVSTAGFASSVGSGMIKAGKNIIFKSIGEFFIWVKKLYPQIWSKFILPLSKNIGGIITKITTSLSKIQGGKVGKGLIPDKIVKFVSTAKEYLIKIKTAIEDGFKMILGKTLSKTVGGYAKYKTRAEFLKYAGQTKTGENIIKHFLPYINPLLGSDKIDPFLLDLINNPEKIDLLRYNILPIFKDNSLDSFT